MRITCPKCEAQYEIADEAISADGRAVQCSNCTHTWLQLPKPTLAAVSKSKPTVDLSDSAFEAGATNRPRRTTVDPAIANILREEAELAQQTPQEPARNPRNYPTRDEINTALRPKPEAPAAKSAKKKPKPRKPRGQGGFMRGFSVMILFTSVLVAPYVFANDLTAAFPQIEPYMSTYVELADRARLGLNEVANQVMALVAEYTGQADA